MNDKNRVAIFDCQLLQTKAWHRGMGKYTAKFIDAFLENENERSEYEKVVLLFNSKNKFSDELRQFTLAHKNAEVKFLTLDVPIDGNQSSITKAQVTNKERLDTYIEDELGDSDISFLITSLFLDEACPVFPTKSHNSLIFYDLIPLMYYKLYLGLGPSEQYFTRFSVVFAADQIFAISETVANDLVTFLGISKDKVINIRGASNHLASERKSVNPNLSIQKPYILMPTGGDPRKNNLNGVIGFSRFNEQNDNKYQLVITSIFTDVQKDDLRKYSDDILFTDNVSDNELWWLYENATTILFPTEYEGLGMPILEAVDAEKTIVCSDISVFREISLNAFYTFDPQDPDAIGNALEQVIMASPREVAHKTRTYLKISSLYTWKSTAEIVAEHLKRPSIAGRAVKPKIAIVTPNICQASEDARYMALQYAKLSDDFDVDFYYDTGSRARPVRPSFLGYTTPTRSVLQLTESQYLQYDMVVYFMTNSDMSVLTLHAALSMPGLVIYTDRSIENVYRSSLGQGIMTPERFKVESGNYMQTLSDSSRATATTRLSESAMVKVGVAPNKLAYASPAQESLTNRIFVNYNPVASDNSWNINFIKDICSVVDKSRANFIVVSRTEFLPEVYKELDQPGVTLYEDVSDHEYLTLLNSSDLFIDARPGDALNKTFPAFEAAQNGLKVFLSGADSVICANRDVHVAPDDTSLRDLMYRWLVDTLEEDNKPEACDHPVELTQVIVDAIKNKKEKQHAESN